MKTLSIYCMILLVYFLLWACQLVVCHMTHSLIILTDSYINLYKILDVSLGIVHLCTQRELIDKQRLTGAKSVEAGAKPILAGRLFSCICTYHFKRLPLLGSFMNGLFLAALLMSAGIEGIQTCVHSSHLESADGGSILHKDRLTYPLILASFALVGLIMQHCSLKAHEMREEELQSESFMDLSGIGRGWSTRHDERTGAILMQELTANNLNQRESSFAPPSSPANKRQSYNLDATCQAQGERLSGSISSLPSSLAGHEIPNNEERRVSLKLARNLDDFVPPAVGPIGTISHDLEARQKRNEPAKSNLDGWFLVRYLASPSALLAYASINYFVSDVLLREISDASLSICVVFLLFAASYPPMKKAGRVLLQTAPDGVDLSELEKDLAASNEHILGVQNLHVWSLTPRSNRVATCELLLDKSRVTSEKQIELILSEVRFRFRDQNINCTTIEPVLKSREQRDE